MPRLILALLSYLLLVAAVSTGIGWIGLSDSLGRLQERANSDLSLAADRLTAQLQRYRDLAVLLADHPALTHIVLDGSPDTEAAMTLLLSAADRTHSLEIALLDANGRVIVTSDPAASIGADHAAAPHFRRAQQGAMGFEQAVDPRTGQRMFLFAAPIFSRQGPVGGAVVVRFSVDRIEANWRDEIQTVFFTDAAGVVFVSNRSELVFAKRQDVAKMAALRDAVYPAGVLHDFVPFSTWKFLKHDLWSIDGGPYLPAHALHLVRPVLVAGLTAEILLDSDAATRLALLQAATAAALLLILGAIVLVLLQRRRALAERLRIEALSKGQLEVRVAIRTRELSEAVRQLREEVRERKEAEAALTKAQQELVQAGKLSALGQMSAGISHELNQPLMAIRSFSENAGLLIERGDAKAAAQNLEQISEMARRMGRIIKNLRAFARQETVGFSEVNLVAVVRSVLEMVETRLLRASVRLDWAEPECDITVLGGEVRLQQVVLNLVSNALDAMEGIEDARLSLKIEQTGGRTRLIVRDNGQGIQEPDRIFDPFYSTKEVGQAEGMGLGLSIAYRIVESFSGTLSASNCEDGGAQFVLDLPDFTLKEVA
jgi:two-component system C4-dicarboxylate transport sensor histidine kinase DctB